MGTVLKVKVDEFLAHKIENLVERGAFKSEDEFLKRAVEELVRKWEARALTMKMDVFAEEIAKKHPESVASAVLKARAEEDEVF